MDKIASKPSAQMYEDADVRKLLEEAVKAAGSLRALGEHLGVSAQFIHQVLTGKERPSSTLLRALGLRRIAPLYVEIDDTGNS